MDNISIALLCSLLGAGISYLTFQKHNKKDAENEAREETVIKTKLDYIALAMDEIRLDNKARDREMKEIRESIILLNASIKEAHKRLDTIEGKM